CWGGVAAKSRQGGPGIIERIENRRCLAKHKRQGIFNHDAMRPTCGRCQSGWTLKKSPVMKWITGRVALRQRLDHLEARPATVGSPAPVLCRSPNCSRALVP